MIERKQVQREHMSMDRIREFMQADPDAGRELRRHNKSFVFFRATGLKDDQEAIGAQGIPLTARRSIAVDRHLHVYGTPFWIEADLPIATEKSETKFRHLMIAQDTGSAIIGPARADLDFGAGKDAGAIAGRIRQQGRFVMLLPRELDMIEAGKEMPLPLPKPVIPEEGEDKKGEDKKEAGKTEQEAGKSADDARTPPQKLRKQGKPVANPRAKTRPRRS
jgi:membrane-bound lytic murein transglycosylase A